MLLRQRHNLHFPGKCGDQVTFTGPKVLTSLCGNHLSMGHYLLFNQQGKCTFEGHNKVNTTSSEVARTHLLQEVSLLNPDVNT